MMDHPNIAKVLDAGATPEGHPFFVMELVKGVPITKYSDEHKLTPRERLELFVPVCQAIQHAHQKGVIHRDIKPNNVLVALYDNKPVPKVIDFGVAKAAGQPLTDKTLATGFGAVVGTPEYMSPEQANFNNLDIDTRSDVYALGVLLYELLAGSPPFTHKEMEKLGLMEIFRVIREQEPPKPSTKLSTADALPTLSASRGTEPKRLTALLRGELDWIVMKALEKDRTRRYETPNGFAADVLRYLSGEPVQAVPPSAGYRLRKFLSRNRRPVVAAGLVLLALAGGLIGTTFGLTEARKQREITSLWQRAEGERDAAQFARGEAEAARDREKLAKKEVEDAREKLAVFEYGRTMQVAHQEWRENNVPAALALLAGTRPDLRGWEWHYIHRLCHSELFTLGEHAAGVNTAVFSPDGARIATSSKGSVKIWDAKSGAEILALKGHVYDVDSVTKSGAQYPVLKGYKYEVNAIAFSPDGSRIITAGSDETARVWDAKTGAELLMLQYYNNRSLRSASFSPDGSRIVTSHGERTAKVWDAKTGAELLTLNGHRHGEFLWSASFSPDGTRIVTASDDATAKVWDAKTGTELFTLSGGTGPVISASFSPDGSRIVTGTRRAVAKVWDARTGTELLTLKGHTADVWSASFSPDGSRIVTASWDRTARVWDAKTGRELLTLKGHTDRVRSASFSPDGLRVLTASADKTAKVWDAKTEIEHLTLKALASDYQPGSFSSISFSADGTRIVTGGSRAARVWDAANGSQVLAVKGHNEGVESASFSPDGSRIVTGSYDQTAKIWDAKTGAVLLTLKGHTNNVWSASFSPDGSRVVSGSQDEMAKVWDAKTGAVLLTLPANAGDAMHRKHWGCVWSAAFSPDGLRIVTGSSDRTATIWDAKSGAEVLTLKGHTGRVRTAVFSRDGSRIVTGSDDTTAKVWDAATGIELLTLKGHTKELKSAEFSPDGTRIVTGSEDETAKVWDAKTGAILLTLKGHSDFVGSVAFSPDGWRIGTAGDDWTARVWDARPVSREFLPGERPSPPGEVKR